MDGFQQSEQWLSKRHMKVPKVIMKADALDNKEAKR
jgi:hypothetical protein